MNKLDKIITWPHNLTHKKKKKISQFNLLSVVSKTHPARETNLNCKHTSPIVCPDTKCY